MQTVQEWQVIVLEKLMHAKDVQINQPVNQHPKVLTQIYLP